VTEAETIDALERIHRIELFAQEPAAVAFGVREWSGWEEASRRLAQAIEDVAERLRAFIRVDDPAVGIVLTDWTGDIRCVWNGPSETAARQRHLRRFAEEFTFRIRLGHTLAAAVRAALTISRAATASLTAPSAVLAAWELVRELDKLRAVPQ
jgi:hypothetical protein